MKISEETTRRIIALVGKDQNILNIIKQFFIKHYDLCGIMRIDTSNCSSDEFLDKILKGDILEASCDDETNIISGTSKLMLQPEFLYIGIYTPHQLANLLEATNEELEILPIEIEVDPHILLQDILEDINTINIYSGCKKYIKIEDNYDTEGYLDDVTCLCQYYDNYDELLSDLDSGDFLKQLKDFNTTNNLITNLDNFI